MRRPRNRAQRLRTAVELLPRHTREAMLRGIERNAIVVGAYADRDGGVCPMLAAHRNGGRTSFASFATAWDAFTDARRPRRATRREIRALRTYLEMSLLEDEVHAPAPGPAPEPPVVRPGDPSRFRELRLRRRWAWLRPARRLDVFEATLAAAEEQHSEQRAEEILKASRRRSPLPGA